MRPYRNVDIQGKHDTAPRGIAGVDGDVAGGHTGAKTGRTGEGPG